MRLVVQEALYIGNILGTELFISAIRNCNFRGRLKRTVRFVSAEPSAGTLENSPGQKGPIVQPNIVVAALLAFPYF